MTAVGNVYTLTISGTTVKMTGNYRCVATNKHGTAEHSALITISDGKTPVKKPEEPKPEEKKPEEPKPQEKRVEEPKSEEPKVEEKPEEKPKAPETKPKKEEPVAEAVAAPEEVLQIEETVSVPKEKPSEVTEAEAVLEIAAPGVVEEKPKEAPKPTGNAPVFEEVYQEMTLLEKKTLTLTVRLSGKPAPDVIWYR